MALTGLENWQKLAESEGDLPFGFNHIAVVELPEKKICVAHYQDKLYAFAATCPHAGGIMSDGYLDAVGNIVCPIHGYKFSLQNGRNTSGEGYVLKHWPVETRPDGVFILC